MAQEYARPPYNRDVGIPVEYGWQSLKSNRGAELEGHHVTLLRELGTWKGLLGQIFTNAQSKIQDPAKLYRLIDMVDDTRWVTMDADIKGDVYEDLLERSAEDTKSGVGQYFTPRALIRAMVASDRTSGDSPTFRSFLSIFGDSPPRFMFAMRSVIPHLARGANRGDTRRYWVLCGSVAGCT